LHGVGMKLGSVTLREKIAWMLDNGILRKISDLKWS